MINENSLFPVPNVSFQVYAPGFFSRFMESHAVMFQGNAGLKPKEGEVTSRPWQWPINYKVKTGQCFYRQFTEMKFLSSSTGAIFLRQFLQSVPVRKSDHLVEQFGISGRFLGSFFHILCTRATKL